jgi:hypothetical protein
MKQMPNPSIEGTRSGLRPARAPHVKRFQGAPPSGRVLALEWAGFPVPGPTPGPLGAAAPWEPRSRSGKFAPLISRRDLGARSRFVN